MNETNYSLKSIGTDRWSFNLDTDNSIMYLNSALTYADPRQLGVNDLYLLKVSSISFDEQAPKKEALENVLSSVRMEGINFVFLIMGSRDHVDFYYGISRDLYADQAPAFMIRDIGEDILKPAISANFRGSTISCLDDNLAKKGILDRIRQMENAGMIEGVPGANKDDEKYQGIDRLINVMYGDTYCFMVIAKPLSDEAILQIQSQLYHFYDAINPMGKASLQTGSGQNTGSSSADSTGSSETTGTNKSKTITEGNNNGYSSTEGSGTNISESKGTSRNNSNSGSHSSSGSATSHSGSKGTSTSKSETYSAGNSYSVSAADGSSTSSSTNKGHSDTTSEGKSSSSSTTFEIVNRRVQDFIKFMDDVVFPRLDYGKGKGIFQTSMFVCTEEKTALQKIKNTVTALYSGEAGNKVPLKAMDLKPKARQAFANFQLPCGRIAPDLSENELLEHFAMHQLIDWNGHARLGNWITTNELGMVAGLPQKEVVGLSLNEEVEFGLNFSSLPKENDRIELGTLIQNGNELEKTHVYLDKKELDKHIFVTGVTGSGKTTTCQKILKASGLPFLVIEPAKTEYRVMQKSNPDMLIFTLGDNMTNPLRMNPFMFYPHESITSRVDMLCASIESAFEMEAAIPQIIERALYKCYEDYGWNISTGRNHKYQDPFDGSGSAFPTMSDLVENCSVVVKQQGFDDRLKNDYIGSINARLLGLTSGSKGFLLNTHASVDFVDLLDHQVVFELENIRSGAEKSLIMGFVLINLSEAIREKYRTCGKFGHITLVEEAHRLLSKFTPGDNPNKKHGVEMFADMLAEIRKYGECLIIADQIPNKLTPDVLKNTNTKIIHRIFAEDDKEAVGNTVMLKQEQKDFLSNLQAGRAIFFTSATEKAVQVQIKRSSDTSEQTPDNEEIKPAVTRYFRKNYRRGLFPGLEFMKEEPSQEQFLCFEKLYTEDFVNRYIKAMIDGETGDELQQLYEKACNCLGDDIVSTYLWRYGVYGKKDVIRNFKEKYKDGLFPGLELMDHEPNTKQFECFGRLYSEVFAKRYIEALLDSQISDELSELYNLACTCLTEEIVLDYLWKYGVSGNYQLGESEYQTGRNKLASYLAAGSIPYRQKIRFFQPCNNR